jgi:hypothetical protein
MAKLHQTTAILKGIKARLYAEVTALHKEAQKPEPYTGLIKTYRKKDEDGEAFTEPGKKVTLQATDVLKKLAKLSTETFDTTAEQDWANTLAKADVIVDGQTILKDVPVTYLLFLEKQVTDIRTFVDKMPTLDENKDWSLDPNSNLYRTEKIESHKTKKVQRAIVKYDATPHHPAQTEMITEDVIIGWWDTTHLSGAMPIPRKEQVLERIDKFLRAVKMAREAANDQDVTERKVGEVVFGYLFA